MQTELKDKIDAPVMLTPQDVPVSAVGEVDVVVKFCCQVVLSSS